MCRRRSAPAPTRGGWTRRPARGARETKEADIGDLQVVRRSRGLPSPRRSRFVEDVVAIWKRTRARREAPVGNCRRHQRLLQREGKEHCGVRRPSSANAAHAVPRRRGRAGRKSTYCPRPSSQPARSQLVSAARTLPAPPSCPRQSPDRSRRPMPARIATSSRNDWAVGRPAAIVVVHRRKSSWISE